MAIDQAAPQSKTRGAKTGRPVKPAINVKATKATEAVPRPKPMNTPQAAQIIGRSPATLKRWRLEGQGPDFVEICGRVRYYESVLLEFIRANTRVPSVRAAMERIRDAGL